MNVLITGAAGLIGRQLTPVLEREHTLRLGDLKPIADPRWLSLDVTRPDDLRAAMSDLEAVVHLAIASGHEGEFEDDAFNQQRFDVNVKGTWNLLEAARRAGVRRFVYTSSLMVVWGYPSPEWVASDAPARPVGTYALTKYFGELLCENAARHSRLEVICLRIAKPIDLDDPASKARAIRPQWIAFHDLLEAYRLALVAPTGGFEIVTLVGESSRRRWDLSKAQRILGYRPKCRLEELGYNLGPET
jgi:uronate dehydrogenase